MSYSEGGPSNGQISQLVIDTGLNQQATINDMDFMFPVPALPSITKQRCKYEGMNMQSLATVLCQIWGQFHWNLVLHAPKCPILKGVHQTARSPNGL